LPATDMTRPAATKAVRALAMDNVKSVGRVFLKIVISVP
jgi:hypothetical protein